jgi:hypothetical protein
MINDRPRATNFSNRRRSNCDNLRGQTSQRMLIDIVFVNLLLDALYAIKSGESLNDLREVMVTFKATISE